MKIFIIFVLFPLVSWSHDISPKDFFKLIEDEYTVLMINGEKNTGGEMSVVLAEDEEVILSMPYCYNGACNPGYIFLKYNETKIDKWDFGQFYSVYSIMNPKVGKFTWEDNGGIIHFTNYQLALPDGKTMTMQHVVKKKSTI